MSDELLDSKEDTSLAGTFYDTKTQFPSGFNPAQQKALFVGAGADLKAVDLSNAELRALKIGNKQITKMLFAHN